jgi:hypothetical protein
LPRVNFSVTAGRRKVSEVVAAIAVAEEEVAMDQIREDLAALIPCKKTREWWERDDPILGSRYALY